MDFPALIFSPRGGSCPGQSREVSSERSIGSINPSSLIPRSLDASVTSFQDACTALLLPDVLCDDLHLGLGGQVFSPPAGITLRVPEWAPPQLQPFSPGGNVRFSGDVNINTFNPFGSLSTVSEVQESEVLLHIINPGTSAFTDTLLCPPSSDVQNVAPPAEVVSSTPIKNAGLGNDDDDSVGSTQVTAFNPSGN